jgi:hypothetical protein
LGSERQVRAEERVDPPLAPSALDREDSWRPAAEAPPDALHAVQHCWIDSSAAVYGQFPQLSVDVTMRGASQMFDEYSVPGGEHDPLKAQNTKLAPLWMSSMPPL